MAAFPCHQLTLNYCTFSVRRYVKISTVPKKKKSKTFCAVDAVKALARERIGPPPVSRVVPNRKKKPQKRKPTLDQLLGDSE
jgi:hypothetical protein